VLKRPHLHPAILKPLRVAALGCLALLLVGCDDRFDDSALYKGMDRSTILGHYGTPDKRKVRAHTERLTYMDGDHYQYLLMLSHGELVYWEQERVYKANRFSDVRGRADATE